MHGASNPLKIVIFEVEPTRLKDWAGLGAGHEVLCVPEALTPENADRFADAGIISTFLGSRLDVSVLSRLPALKLVATRSTGFDYIDRQACATAGISVCNVPDYGDPTVAEFVFALLLSLSRKVPMAGERARRGDFSQVDLRGFDLAGKVMGVVGLGRIGRRVIQIAKGFGMTVIGHDAAPEAGLESRLGFRSADLGTLLEACDVLSLHIPGGAQNVGLISAPELARMKPSALLINTSRGEVVDAGSLVMALSEGRLAGAGLDVFAQEGLLRDDVAIFRTGEPARLETLRSLAATHALLAMPNVVATAHIAYDTREAVARILTVTRKNIEAYIAGVPENIVADPRPVGGVRPDRPEGAAAAYELAMGTLSDELISCRRSFLAEPGPGEVHALRGALRRARAGLLMFKDISPPGECTWVRSELERMIRHLGPLRDLDVLQAQYDLDLAAPSGVFPDGFGQLLVAARKVAAENALARVRAPRATFLLEGFPDWLKGQGAALSGRNLQQHMIAWMTAADSEIRTRGTKELIGGNSARHKLREQIKVLNYNFGIYDRIHHPDGAEPYLAALESLHTLLGDLNDDAVGARLRHSLINPDARPRDVGRPSKARREALVRAWDHFDALPRPWADQYDGGAASF